MKYGLHLGTVNPRFWGDVAGEADEADRLGQIRLGTPVYNIGLRHPLITARAF